MFIPRALQPRIKDRIVAGDKVVIIYGPRQAGKTTLVRSILKELPYRSLEINADQLRYIDVLASRNLDQLRLLTEGYELLFIDEAQRIPDVGLTLKILHDELPALRVVATGSSSFLLSSKVEEALTGRKKVFTLLPISVSELKAIKNSFELQESMDELLVYGMYPEVVKTPGHAGKEEYLRELVSSYIFRDIFEIEQVRYPTKIRELLRLLAWQTGSQVSLHELCNALKINRETVERYLDLLERSFIIFSLNAWSKNPRKEVSKSRKYFFYDNGIRNILVDDLRNTGLRQDTGMLWENLMIAERRKRMFNHDLYLNAYFWRSYSGSEVDYIEEREGQLMAFEFKYGKPRNAAPAGWTSQYGGTFTCITKQNFLNHLD